MTETPLDQAHAAMDSAPDDDQKRLRFFERLADCELFLLLKDEPLGDQVARYPGQHFLRAIAK